MSSGSQPLQDRNWATRWPNALRRVQKRPFLLSLLILLFLNILFLRPILFPPEGWATGGADIRALFVPWLTFARDAILQGRLPLWDGYHSAGYPFLANPQVAFFYPPTWLAFLFPIRIGLSLHILLHTTLLATGTVVAARTFGATWLAAFLAALTVTFSSFTGARILAGHIGVIATFSWLPWLLAATTWALRRNTIASAIIAGIPFGLAILAGHTTSLAYVGIIWLGLCVYQAAIQQNVVPLRNFVISFFTGLGLAGIQLLPLLQFAQFSSRLASGDFQSASEFSLPIGHLVTLLLPEFFGEPTNIGYWSVPVFEEFAYYAGIIPLLAIPLALHRPSPFKIFLLITALFGLWLALGRNSVLYEQLYALMPPFRLARAPARAGVLYTFAVAFLLAETVSSWRLSRDRYGLKSALLPVLAISLTASTAALASTGATFAALHPGDETGRLWHQIGGWVWLTAMLGLGGLVLWRYLAAPENRLRTHILGIMLALLIIADLWNFAHKMIRQEPTTLAPLWSETAQQIGNTNERILPWGVSIFEQNGAGMLGLHSVFSYNALSLAANDALTGSVPDPRSTAYDVLSTAYVISGVPLDNFTEGERALSLVHSSENAWIYRRPRVMPVTRLVSDVEIIAGDAQALERLHQPDFDPAQTVILRERPTCLDGEQVSDLNREARLVARDAASWQIETSSPSPAILVLSESAYPGWRVAIDGNEADPLLAYTALRAVCIPAGNHTVRWVYSPTIYIAGALLSLTAVVFCGWATWQTKKRS